MKLTNNVFGIEPTATTCWSCSLHRGPTTCALLSRTDDQILIITDRVNEICLEAEPWSSDPGVVPLPWRQQSYEEVQSRKLTIGFIQDDNVVKVHPPIRRVLEDVARKLELAGHEIIPWNCSEHKEGIDLMVRIQFLSSVVISDYILGPLLYCRRRTGYS